MGQWWAEIDGPLAEEALAEAWNHVVDRHTALRSAFHWELKDQPFQVVHRQVDLRIERIDWSSEPNWREALAELLASDRKVPFELKKPPLMRVRLIRLGKDRHVMVWTRHHLAVDGWSLATILNEVFSAYRALKESKPLTLRPATPYRRYVEWERQRDPASARRFWQDQLTGRDLADPSVHAPTVSTGPKIVELVDVVGAPTVAELLELGRANRITLNTFVQGAWAIVLARLSGARDVVFGSVETIRPPHLVAEAAPTLVGMQIDILPVIATVDDTPLGDWLRVQQARMASGREVGGIALDELRDLLGRPRDVLPFESLVGFQNYPLDETGPFADSGLTVRDSGDLSLPDMPLNLMVETGDTMTLRLMADSRHYDEDSARQILAMLATVLQGMTRQFSNPVSRIEALPDAATHRLLSEFAPGPDVEIGRLTAPELILRRAAATPEAIAIRRDDETISYQDLVGAAWRLAEQLTPRVTADHDRIGILLERSPAAIAAILAVQLVGAAYIPLDVEAPAERRDAMVRSAGIETLITSAQHAPVRSPLKTILVDELAFGPAPGGPEAAASDEDEAYVIFTSGSTGEPKGVIVGHDNLRHHIAARMTAYPDHPIQAFLLTFPLVFDGSVTVIFNTLVSGGTLVLPTAGQSADPARLASLIESAQVTHTDMIPSLWQLVLDMAEPGQLASLALCLVAGESCPRDLVRLHYRKLPGVPLYNEYGPTETTVWATADHCRPDEEGSIVPIGRPVPGCRAYVVDHFDRLCPIGQVGELVIAGALVARGYIGDNSGAAARFGANRFANQPAYARCYRTGDRAAFGFDGRLRLYGRLDHQVKVNGYRIELGEIETCLNAHPGIRESAVLVQQANGASAGLVAHIAGADLPAPQDVRDHMRRHLPAYMVPQRVVGYRRLPRTGTGKLDATKLTAPAKPADLEPPQGPRETALAAIWQAVLGRDEISRTDSFFELGGNSLLAMQLVAKIRRDLKLDAELLDVFEAPEIGALAQRLDRASTRASGLAEPIARRRRETRQLPLAPNGDSGHGRQ